MEDKKQSLSCSCNGTPRVKVGQQWPEIEGLWISKESARTQTARDLMRLLCLLLVIFLFYGMVWRDLSILENVFEVLKAGFFAGLGWVFGNRQKPED